MKIKTLLYPLSLLVAAMTMTACSSENDENIAGTISDNSSQTGTWQVIVNASADGAQTRALSVGGDTGNSLFTNWDSNDEVKVYKDDGTYVGTLTPDLSNGNNSAFAKLTGTLTGTFAAGDPLKLYYIGKDFSYSSQDGTLAKVSSSCSFMAADVTVQEIGLASGEIKDGSTKYLTLSDATFAHEQSYLDLTFTDDVGSPIAIKKLEIWAEGNKVVNTISGGTTTYVTEADPLVIDRGTDPALSRMFIALRDDNGAANNYHFKATATDGTIYFYEGSKNLAKGQFYTGTVAMAGGGMDIGLFVGGASSGKPLLWAKMNVGATTETDPGLYFAWGDVTGRDGSKSSGSTAADGYSYNWTNYRFGNGLENKLTKYCYDSSYGNGGFTDALMTLVPNDDAATYCWGGKWRMPTAAELNALAATKSNTTDYSWEWKTNYKGSGTYGYLITYKVNNSSIFLPAAGNRRDANVNDDVGYGYYWSSSLSTSTPIHAHFLEIGGDANIGQTDRYVGYTVRPVLGN